MQQISLGSGTYKSFLARSRGYVLLTLNLAGAVDYECLASRSWAIPQERGLHSETGEPFVWAFSVMPVFTIFFVVDVFWGALILVSQQWRRGYFVAADGPDLAGRCSDGFCAPLTARRPRSRYRKASFKAWRRANGRAGGRLKPSREITQSGSSSTFDYLGRTPRLTRGRRLRTQILRPAAARNRAGSWYPRSAAS